MTNFRKYILWLLSAGLLGAILLATQHAEGSSADSSTITGRTVASVAGNPVAGANLELTMLEEDSASALSPSGVNVFPALPGAVRHPATSDSNGEFRFSGLKPGQYLLAARKDGFAFSPYGGNHPFMLPVPINLGAGETASVEVGLLSGGGIIGSVQDDNGRPITEGQIQALGLVWARGSRYKVIVKSVEARASGDFELSGLPPGEYLVRYVTPNHATPAWKGVAATPVSSAVAYYGGKFDGKCADDCGPGRGAGCGHRDLCEFCFDGKP